MKLTTLADGSVLATWPNERGYLDSAQYVRHRDRVFQVSERGSLLPAFGGLHMHHKEPLDLAVRRGLSGERGAPRIDWPRVARRVLLGAIVTALIVYTFPQ
jgi:hypothetical protein